LESTSLLVAPIAVLTNDLTKLKAQSARFPSLKGDIRVRQTVFVEFLKVLIISSSAIVEKVSEVISTSSELISTSSE